MVINPHGVKPSKGRAILRPNPTANSASVTEEEGEACETSLLKSPQGLSTKPLGFFILSNIHIEYNSTGAQGS